MCRRVVVEYDSYSINIRMSQYSLLDRDKYSTTQSALPAFGCLYDVNNKYSKQRFVVGSHLFTLPRVRSQPSATV